MQEYTIDFIQLFYRGHHSKNGADIRMAIDVVDDIALNPHITTVVIISCDSDYVSIAQNIRRKGKLVIGIGIGGSTNQYWVKSCNEFKFYDALLVKSQSSSIDALEQRGYVMDEIDDETKDLLAKAVSRLAADKNQESVLGGQVKEIMKRLDPSFDESNYGYGKFSDFLDHCKDVVKIDRKGNQPMVSLNNSNHLKHKHTYSHKAAHDYKSILKNQQIHLPNPDILLAGIKQTFNLFQKLGKVVDYTEYREQLGILMKSCKSETTSINLKKIQILLYKSHSLSFSQDKIISLDPKIKNVEMLVERIIGNFMGRITSNIDEEPDYKAISELFFGEDSKAAYLQKMQDSNAAILQKMKEKRISQS